MVLSTRPRTRGAVHPEELLLDCLCAVSLGTVGTTDHVIDATGDPTRGPRSSRTTVVTFP